MNSSTPMNSLSTVAIAIVLNACGERAPDPQPPKFSSADSAQPKLPTTEAISIIVRDSFPELRDWTGVPKALLEFHLKGHLQASPTFALSDFQGVNRPLLTLTVDGKKLEFNELGRRVNRKLYSTNYYVRRVDGTMYIVPFKDVLSANSFNSIRKEYQEGGIVMRLPLPSTADDTAQTAMQWFPGNSPRTSYLVESLGRLNTAPNGLKQWQPQYSGNHVYRIFRVDPSTGKEGQQLGWAVDALSKRVEFSTGLSGFYILKRFFSNEGVTELPNFLVVRPDGMVTDPSGNELHYHGEVVDSSSEPVREGIFRRFSFGPLIVGVNAPAPNAWGQTPSR